MGTVCVWQYREKGQLSKKMASGKDQAASLNDVFGMMGGLMTALAPPKDAEAIKGGMDQLGLVMGGLFEGMAKDTVKSNQEIPTRVGKPIYEWLPLDDKTKLPEHALLAGTDQENTLFVGRGVLDGSIRLGKYHRKYQGLFVAHNGKEVEVWENIEILCVAKDAEVKWEDVEDGNVPAGAIVGTIVDGNAEFIGRGVVGAGLSPGRIVGDCMYASFGGREKVLKKYQALVITNSDPLYSWVPVDNWIKPGTPVCASEDVYVGRVSLLDKIRLAKVSFVDKKLYVAHSGKQEEVTNVPFEVLCLNTGANAEWKSFADGKVPTRAILASIVDGRFQFVGRGNVGGDMCVGAIVPSDGCMHVPHGGKSETLTKYEALVIQ